MRQECHIHLLKRGRVNGFLQVVEMRLLTNTEDEAAQGR